LYNNIRAFNEALNQQQQRGYQDGMKNRPFKPGKIWGTLLIAYKSGYNSGKYHLKRTAKKRSLSDFKQK
jgi:hypothetical protein